MEEMMKHFNESYDIVAKIAAMPEQNALATVCVLLDQVAHNMGMSTVELLDDIRPIIEQVNAEMGKEGLVL